MFNLIFFISSFCFTSLSGLASSQNVHNFNHVQKQFSSKEDTENGCCSQLVFEENEKENESIFHTQAFVVPFLGSYFEFEISQSTLITLQPVLVEQTNPIYIAVCNFRV